MKGAFQMEKTIVGAIFQNKNTGAYEGKVYNYYCEVDVKVGDLVKVPTSIGESVAKVCAVNVSKSSISPKILPIMKTITSFAESQVD
jgi:hypothetical protein